MRRSSVCRITRANLASEHPSGPKDVRALCRQARPHRLACAAGALRPFDPGHDHRGYVGTDFALDDLIDRHTQEETRPALKEVLTATTLAGEGGRMIAARSQFRGRTRDGDVQAYVRFLMQETDLRLGVCDWGYCVYRVETAACFGDEKGPNPVLRTESTCLCANFAVMARHRPVWQARRDRNADLLDHPGLDPVSRRVAETRIAECGRILGELEKDGRHGA
ncbi:hypothetical protein [Sinorhizobium medicae]|uniref:hypothetical protein n=1 Tax=Sinorhizobium medicae TaxID=110321 RepID=UPI0027DBE546|nr:hypothetical protein [Sinorhizobium medicae]